MNSRLVAARDINIPRIRAAENIRRELKAAFPGVNFSVKTKSFSGGNDINISWTDGPTTEEVQAITSKYEEGSFDGMVDMYNYHKDRDDLIGGAKYVFENRHISDEAWAREFKKMGYDYKKGSGFYGFELIDADGAAVDSETVRHLMREVSNKSFYDGPRGGKADLIREPYEDKWRNPKPATEESAPDEKTDTGTTVDMNEVLRKSVPSGLMHIIDPREATARRRNMDTRAADKKKYDPNTSYERENLERIAKEWAKFCKDKGVLNPGRHDFRIWMEQNYPRITPLDALKQMAMDAVWGKADPYRSPSNGEPEHQADHYQKRMSGDKDKKEKTEAARVAAAKNETIDLGMGDKIHVSYRGDADDKGRSKVQVTWECGTGRKKGQLIDIIVGNLSGDEVKEIVNMAKSALYETQILKSDDKIDDAQTQIRELQHDIFMRVMKGRGGQGGTAAKIDRVWVITYPGPQSTLKDILFAANVADLQKQFAGGLDPKDVFGMYDNDKEARENAEALLSALPGKIEAAMRAKAGEEWEPPKSGARNYGYLRFEHQPNGDIKVTANPENIGDIIEMLDEEGQAGDDAMYDLLSGPGNGHALGNGYTIVKPEDVGALTDGLLLGDGGYDDKGDVYTGNVWWFADYQVKGFAEELANGRPITLVYSGFASPTEKPEGIATEGNRKVRAAMLTKAAGQYDKDLMRRWRAVLEGLDATKEIKEYFSYGTSGDQPYKQMLEIAMWAWKEVAPIRKVVQDNILAWEKSLGTTAIRTRADTNADLLHACEYAEAQISGDPDFEKMGANIKGAVKTLRRAINKAKPGTFDSVAMRTRADADDEGGDLRTELTDEDGTAIIDKIQNTPDMQDSDFHEFVEGLGIKPSAAETFAYGLLYDLLNEGSKTEEEPEPPIEMGAEARRKAKAADVMVFIPENDIIPEKGEMSTNQVVALLRKYKGDPTKIQFIADMMEK